MQTYGFWFDVFFVKVDVRTKPQKNIACLQNKNCSRCFLCFVFLFWLEIVLVKGGVFPIFWYMLDVLVCVSLSCGFSALLRFTFSEFFNCGYTSNIVPSTSRHLPGKALEKNKKKINVETWACRLRVTRSGQLLRFYPIFYWNKRKKWFLKK